MLCHKCRWLDAQALGRSLTAAIGMHAIIAQRFMRPAFPDPCSLRPATAARESHNCVSGFCGLHHRWSEPRHPAPRPIELTRQRYFLVTFEGQSPFCISRTAYFCFATTSYVSALLCRLPGAASRARAPLPCRETPAINLTSALHAAKDLMTKSICWCVGSGLVVSVRST